MILSVSSCFPMRAAEASIAGEAQSETAAESETEAAAEVEIEAEIEETFEDNTEEVTSEAFTEETEEEALEASAEDTEEETEASVEENNSETVPEALQDEPQGTEEVMEEVVLLAEAADEQDYTPKDETPSDDLFAAYVDAEFGISGEGAGKPGLLLKKRSTAGSRLTGDTLAAYRYVSAQLPYVASGEIASTRFTIPDEELTFKEIAWTSEDLGVSAIVKDGAITKEAKEAAAAKFREEYFDLSLLIDALLADHPYLLYWYDKTPKTRTVGYNYKAAYDKEDGIWYLGYSGSITITMPVAEGYAAGDYEEDPDTGQYLYYEVDPSTGQTVQASVENAQAVVSEYESLPDYEKLAAYRQTICDLTSYNYAAIYDGAPYGDPWQLIWVFDGDPGTKVVCEGYAKAFKYLCDRSSFEDDIDCKAVTGEIGGSGHMWNIVTMEDGRHYLTDVTNCDAGTVGADDKLFLAGASGSLQEGYTAYPDGTRRMYYTYDSDTFSLWPEEDLTLSPDSYPRLFENAVVSGIEDKIYTGEALTQEITVFYNGKTLSEGTDYTVSYEDNTDAGTARVIIEGAGYYQGLIEREFTIEKAEQTLSAAEPGKIISGRTASARITGAQGDITAVIKDTAVAQVISCDETGTVSIKGTGAGVTTLTVTAAETGNFRETKLTVQVRVVPGASTQVRLKNLANGIKISWEQVNGAKYYKVYRGTKHIVTTSRLYATDLEVKDNNRTRYTYKVVASTTKDNGSGDSTLARTATGYRLFAVTISSLKNTSAGRMTVTYGMNPKADKYAIYYGTKADMSDAKVITVQGAKNTSRVLSVTKGKTYYVQVQCYIIESGIKYYSGYCPVKSVKITR